VAGFDGNGSLIAGSAIVFASLLFDRRCMTVMLMLAMAAPLPCRASAVGTAALTPARRGTPGRQHGDAAGARWPIARRGGPARPCVRLGERGAVRRGHRQAGVFDPSFNTCAILDRS